MKFKNGWLADNKQWDKINIKLRVSFLTLFALKADWSNREFSITVLDLTLCTS